MTAFVGVVAVHARIAPALPANMVAALRVPGAAPAELHATAGVSCASARTAAGGENLLVVRGIVMAGDVRLDGRDDLVRALRQTDSGAGLHQRRNGDRDDLAIVLAAYGAWGDPFIERLRGDFSFLLWDGARRSLIAARDGLGVRPLYYAQCTGGLCVGNVLDAVRSAPGVSSTLHRPAVASFLEHGWNRDTTTTTFSGVARLAPGTALRARAGQAGTDVARHWRFPDPALVTYACDEEYVERFRLLLDQAVSDRVTGPTTILLSGGLDSPSIAAAARRVAPGFDVRALTLRSAGVEGPDESRLAVAVAGRLGMPHVVHPVLMAPLAGETVHTPEPIDEPDLASARSLNRLIGDHSPVVLQGEDADALLAPPALTAMMRRGSPARLVWDVVLYTVRTGHHPYLGFWLAKRIRFWRSGVQPRAAWLRDAAGPSAVEPLSPTSHSRPEATRRLAQSLWQSIHQISDREYLGAPIEYRWPFLDTRLIEFAFSIPPIPWCQRKEIVRRALTGAVPDEVVRRPKTTVSGYFDRSVADWRARTNAVCPPLNDLTAEYVDAARLAETLRSGDTEQVLGAWRAIQFDRWIRQLDAA